jgi:hypothetical protein
MLKGAIGITRQLKINDFGDDFWRGNLYDKRNRNHYPLQGFGANRWATEFESRRSMENIVSKKAA